MVAQQATQMTFILSLNMRGLRAAPKYLALKELFTIHHPIIILLQETMHPAVQSIGYFCRMFPTWHMAAIDASGLSRGQIAIWDPNRVWLRCFSCFFGIFLTSNIRGFLGNIHILNIYAPFLDRENFWHRLVDFDLLLLPSLVLARDLKQMPRLPHGRLS